MSTAAMMMSAIVGISAANADSYRIGNDSSSTSWYPNQPLLTPSAVAGGNFAQRFDTSLGGMIFAQPLVNNGVVLTVTENGYAYGLNATTGAQIWSDGFTPTATPAVQVSGTPPNTTTTTCGDIGSSIGITGTPVIDPSTGVAYFVAARGTGAGGATQYWMEAVYVATGLTPSFWPSGGVLIEGNANNDSGTTFNGAYQTQRPGLVLVNGVVYAAFSSQCDFLPPAGQGTYSGWLIGVNASSGTLTTLWASEIHGVDGAGIWQSGAAPVVDAQGDIYVITGNGWTYNTLPTPGPGNRSITDFGEAVVELSTSTGILTPVDWFIPQNAVALNSSDLDFGSGGPVALPASMGSAQEPNVLLGAGKQGVLYAMDMANLGGFQDGANLGDNIPSETTLDGGVWGKPAVWPGDGGYIYVPVTNASGGYSTGTMDVLQRTVSASGAVGFQVVGNTGTGTVGYTAGSPIVTSSATTSGSSLVWIINTNDQTGMVGQLQAYDPIPQVSSVPGATPLLSKVWTSSIFSAEKYTQPGVGNAMIYVGTRDGQLLGFGFGSTNPVLTGTNVDFPTTVVAQSSTLTATFTAEVPTTIQSFALSGTDYNIGASAPTTPVSLSAGQTMSVPVTFTPSAYGTQTGTLTANTLTGGTATATTAVNLTGVGLVSSTVVASPMEADFAARPIGGAMVSMPVTLTNTTANPINITGFVPPLSSTPFTVTGAPTTFPTTLGSGSSLTLTISFSPPGSSGNFAHVFGSVATLQTDAGNFGVPISGSADPPANLAILTSPLAFGNVQVGQSSNMSFTVENTGAFPLTITGSTPPTTNGFSAATSLSASTVIAANSSVQETVQFTPTSAGAVTGGWAITSDGGSLTLAITGTGVVNVPDAPTIGVATSANAQATVTWTTPTNDGGATIANFTATATDTTNAANGGQTCVGTGASSTQCTVLGLTNGDTYTFSVSATNAAGTGASSSPSNAVTPVTFPSIPTNVVAVDHQNAASTVSWTAPSSDGGSAIISYTVTAVDAVTLGQTTQICPAQGATPTQCVVTGLVNDASYFFEVAATNGVGTGGSSGPSNVITPQSPGLLALSSPTLALGNVLVGHSLSLSFQVQNKGDLPLTITSATPPTGSPFSATSTLAPHTILAGHSALLETVTFTPTVPGPVTATWTIASDDGNPPLTLALSGIGLPVLAIPGAPTNVTAVGADAQATVTWKPPASDGGIAVTSYRVSATDATSPVRGGQTCLVNATSSQCMVVGLRNYDRYTFAVAATNAVGEGVLSTPSNSVIPYSPVLRIVTKVGKAPTPLRLVAEGGRPGATITYFVANGSAQDCQIKGATLTSSTGGTCVVVAYKAAGPYDPAVSSGATLVTMSGSSSHLTRLWASVTFAPGRSSLSTADKATLARVATFVPSRADLTVTGYATRNVNLAKARARAVASYFAHASLHVVYSAVTNTAANLVTVSSP